jgi:hypothetical protein
VKRSAAISSEKLLSTSRTSSPSSTQSKFVADSRPFTDPDAAARKLLEIANSVEAVQDGRIHIEKINWPFLHDLRGSPAEYRARLFGGRARMALDARERDLREVHASGRGPVRVRITSASSRFAGTTPMSGILENPVSILGIVRKLFLLPICSYVSGGYCPYLTPCVLIRISQCPKLLMPGAVHKPPR